MAETSEMATALLELEHILGDLYDISDRSDRDRKHDLVRLRRQLSTHLPTIGVAAATFAPFVRNGTLEADFRNRLSKVRSTIALHQASWPAVAIDDDNEAFLASAEEVRRTNEQFLAWLKSFLSCERDS